MLYGFASEKNGINAFLLEITTVGDVADLMIIPVFSICVMECLLTVFVILRVGISFRFSMFPIHGFVS